MQIGKALYKFLQISLKRWLPNGTLVAILLSACSINSQTYFNSPQIYVDVTGSGLDQKQALEDAFREAVREASGVLINSKLQLTNNKITKDEVSEFSAGYLSSYEIKRTYKNEGRFFTEIGALVSSSRMMGEQGIEASSIGKVQGDQLYASTSTYLRSKEQGDRFLEHLASQYPKRALSITLGRVSSTVSESRDIWFIVPYRLKWAKGYLDSFQETVGYIAQKSCVTGTDKQPRRCDFNVGVFDGDPDLTWGKGYFLSDYAQAKILKDNFSNDIGILIVIEGSNREEIGRVCQTLILPSKFLYNDDARLSISRTVLDGRLLVHVANPEILDSVSQVSVSVSRECS